MYLEPVAVTVGSVLRGTIFNYVILIGCLIGVPFHQLIVPPRRTDPTLSTTAP